MMQLQTWFIQLPFSYLTLTFMLIVRNEIIYVYVFLFNLCKQCVYSKLKPWGIYYEKQVIVVKK